MSWFELKSLLAKRTRHQDLVKFIFKFLVFNIMVVSMLQIMNMIIVLYLHLLILIVLVVILEKFELLSALVVKYATLAKALITPHTVKRMKQEIGAY